MNINQSPGIRCLAVLLLPALLLWASCAGNPPAGRTYAAGADCTATYDSLLQLPDRALTGSALRERFRASDSGCRNAIALRLFKKLISKVSGSPAADTALPAFFEQQSNDRTLRIPNRSFAAMQAARYQIFINNDMQPAERLLQQAWRDSARLTDSIRVNYYFLLGELRTRQARLQEATELFFRGIALSERLRDSSKLAAFHINLGNVYNALGDFKSAIDTRRKGLAYYLHTGKKAKAFIAYMTIGVAYSRWGKRDSALNNYYLALDLADSTFNAPVELLKLNLNMGDMYRQIGADDSALKYFEQARAINTALASPAVDRLFITTTAPVYATAGNKAALEKKVESYITEYAAAGDLDNMTRCYRCLFLIEARASHFDDGIYFFKRFDSVQRMLTAAENRRITEEMDAKYEVGKKQVRIALQEQEISRKNMLNTLLLGSLSIFMLGGGFIASRTQLRRRRQEVARQQRFTTQLLQRTEDERTRIARDLHDGITQELLLMKHDIGQDRTDVSQKADHIIQEIRMLSRDLRPTMLDTVGLEKSIEHLCHRIMEQQQVFLTCELHYPVHLAKRDELQLFRIIQEAVNNIVKYAGAEAARITLIQKEGQLVAEIRDNGRGFNVKEALGSGQAFGLQSIIERAKALNGKATITSGPAGTVLHVRIPLREASR